MLVNRFVPRGIEGYKKNRSMKLPAHARCNDEDELNRFVKTIKVIDRDRLSQQIAVEITKIKATANFQIKRDPDYGDKFIGKIDVWEYSDWSFAVYVPVKAFK